MALRDLLGSESLRRLVIHFAARPQSRLHFRALERRLGLSRQSLRNGLDTLESLGLISRSTVGRQVVYGATEHGGWVALRALIRDFAAPAEVVGDLLRGVPGVRAACVFGSAAAGSLRADSDVDVLVVDDAADDGELGTAAMEAGMMLGRDVDLKRYTAPELRAERGREGTSYVKRLLAGPVQWAVGSVTEAFGA